MCQAFEFTKFPLSKKEALLNPSHASSLFHELYENTPPDIVNVFTDGSRLENGHAGAAFFIPSLQVEEAFRLSNFTSIFSAELLAILKALEFLYNVELTQINIFYDSLAALKAICNYVPHEVRAIDSIRNIAKSLLHSGTIVSFIWIPSHVNIPGNVVVDRLASSCFSNPLSNHLTNHLSPSERTAILRTKFKSSWTQSLHSKAPNLNLLSRG